MVLASLGVILAAAYILWMVQRVFYGEVTNPANHGLPDLTVREASVLAPLAALAIFMGIASPLFTQYHRALRRRAGAQRACAATASGARGGGSIKVGGNVGDQPWGLAPPTPPTGRRPAAPAAALPIGSRQ